MVFLEFSQNSQNFEEIHGIQVKLTCVDIFWNSPISTYSDDLVIDEYHKYKAELEEIYNYITEVVILRSKTDWYELGEKSTKYFLNLEKRKKAK